MNGSGAQPASHPRPINHGAAPTGVTVESVAKTFVTSVEISQCRRWQLIAVKEGTLPFQPWLFDWSGLGLCLPI